MLTFVAKLVPVLLLAPVSPPQAPDVAHPAYTASAPADVRRPGDALRGSGGTLAIRIEVRRPDIAHQAQIEQRVQIRIVARPGPIPFDMMIDQPRPTGPRYIEAKVGKCIASSNFAAMQSGSGRRLFLFTRDNRIFTGLLERNCEARDYYSGFYLASAADSKLCAERDRLLSRSGANCRLKQIRELIEVGD